MSLLAHALTTVARAKVFLDITIADDDTLIERLVNSATDFIEKYCDRRFKKTTYSNEIYNGSGSNKLLLKQYPVDSASAFTLEKRDSISNEDSFSDIESEDYFVHWEKGIVENVRSIFYSYPRHYRISYAAGYDYDNAASYLSDVGAADLEYACWKLVSSLYDETGTDGGIQSESLGDYSVSYMKATMADDELKGILNKYKRPFGN